MAAANTYRAKTAEFAGTPRLGVTGLKTTINGTTTDFTSDAAESITAVFVDALVADVTINVSDISGVNGLTPGDVGVLELVFEKRAEGRAPAGSGDLTATFSNAVVVSNENDGPNSGVGGATVTWRCSNPSGGSPVSWS
jgi:hypothetical protein